MSFNKNLVVAAFTLSLLVASHGAAALCEENTGIPCSSDAVCDTLCQQKTGQNRYIGGYCSTLVGDPHTCVCRKTCGGPPSSTTAPGALEKPATATH